MAADGTRKRSRPVAEPAVPTAGDVNGGAASSSSALAPAAASTANNERPTKRRRLGQASVLCMRELFRALVRDGDLTEAERLALQNVALLLAQIEKTSGKTWVNFADTQGELKDFTPQQLRFIKPFLERVATELRECETKLEAEDHQSREDTIDVASDVLKLADVPWADGITARELLCCCTPNEDLEVPNKLLEKIVSRLPSKYMMDSRVRELINFYYIKRSATSDSSSCNAMPDGKQNRLRSLLAAVVSVARSIAVPCLGCFRATVGAAFSTASAAVASVVVTLVGCVIYVVSAIWSARPRAFRHDSQEPFWPAVRFFLAALLHGQTKEVFKFLVMIARLRVFVCLGTCNRIFGWILYPLVFVVEKVLKLKKGNRLLGCACEETDDLSLLSWVPVKAAEGLVCLLKLVRHIPLMDFATGPFVEAVEFIHPFLSFLFDLTFSIGIAQGLAMVVDLADEQAQQKLVWMSMGVARMVREAPKEDVAPAAVAVADGATMGRAVAAAVTEIGTSGGEGSSVHGGGAAEAMEIDTPIWTEDGAWNLFE